MDDFCCNAGGVSGMVASKPLPRRIQACKGNFRQQCCQNTDKHQAIELKRLEHAAVRSGSVEWASVGS